DADWFQRNVRAFLEVCDLFGRTAAQHHDELVKRFIEQPAAALGEEQQSQGLTASGPPLRALLRSLEVLRDLRVAADRRDIATRHDDLASLRAAVAAR
ncbi:MAG: monodechloroaminopyrrolnitrin synthase PrnB family protein, partial [Steroidobacteraceae bacterium]